jgi:hypothetical protein
MAMHARRRSKVLTVRFCRAAFAFGLILTTFGALPAKAERRFRDAAAAEPPKVKLTVEPAATGWTWIVRIENTDSVPLRVVGDARLLSLDINPPLPKGGRPTTIHCALPAEMRPSTDEEGIQIVPPGLAYIETFDPRLYCFEAQKARALTAGATVVGRFGFGASRGRSPVPPFAIAPLDDEPARGASKEVVSLPFALPASLPAPDGAPPDGAQVDASPGGAAPTSRLTVSTPSRIDATNVRDLTLSVTVSNPTPRSVALLLRPETIAIDAAGPSGTTRCQWLVVPSPIAELFTTLPPKGRASTDVLVSALCPEAFFDRPGLYVLRARIDTRGASGTSIGIHTFDGEVRSPSATLVRMRTVSHNARQAP